MEVTKVVWATMLVIGGVGYAQGTLDQFYAPNDATQCDIFAVNFNGISPGETFTVGLSGYITRVDVFVARNELQTTGDVSWTLRRTIAGVPVASPAGVLAAGTFSYGDLGFQYTYEPCLISPVQVPVKFGDGLAITLSSDHMFTWAGHVGSPYSWGSFVAAPGSQGPWTPQVAVALGFKTFVQAVPEPSATTLLSLGACALLISRRRRPTSGCT
jgi:hypothetical protein